jgi:hypothetical protein
MDRVYHTASLEDILPPESMEMVTTIVVKPMEENCRFESDSNNNFEAECITCHNAGLEDDIIIEDLEGDDNDFIPMIEINKMESPLKRRRQVNRNVESTLSENATSLIPLDDLDDYEEKYTRLWSDNPINKNLQSQMEVQNMDNNTIVHSANIEMEYCGFCDTYISIDFDMHLQLCRAFQQIQNNVNLEGDNDLYSQPEYQQYQSSYVK